MRGKRVRKGVVFFAMIFIFSMNSVTATKPISTAKTMFSSSFIQYWYCQDWDFERWMDELHMLKDMGVGELILQTVADTGKNYAVYPTRLEGYTSSERDMVGNALRAADEVGIKVRIGLGFNNEWWKKGAADVSWLNREADANIKIISEIYSLYGEYASFEGWYIPHEFSQRTAVRRKHQSNLNAFLKQITSGIRKESAKDIMISPYYNSRISSNIPLAGWTEMLVNILGDSNIDIVALQDGVGVKHNSLKLLPNLFAYTKAATDKLGMRLFGNIETFSAADSGNISSSYDRIAEQFELEKPYVEEFIAFSINHYQNRNEAKQVGYYREFVNHYLSNK